MDRFLKNKVLIAGIKGFKRIWRDKIGSGITDSEDFNTPGECVICLKSFLFFRQKTILKN